MSARRLVLLALALVMCPSLYALGGAPALAGRSDPGRRLTVHVERIDHSVTVLVRNLAVYEVHGRTPDGEPVAFSFETAVFNLRDPIFNVFRVGEDARVVLATGRDALLDREDQTPAFHDRSQLPFSPWRVAELWVFLALGLIAGGVLLALRSGRLADLLRLLRYARPHVPVILLAVFCLVVSAASNMAPILAAGGILNNVLVNLEWADVKFYTVALILAAVLLGVSSFGAELSTRYLMHRVSTDLRVSVGGHLLSLSLRYFSRSRTGELISRLTNDINTTQQALRFVFGDIAREVIMIVFGVSLAFIYCWQLACIVFLVFPLTIIPVAIIARRVNRSATRGLETLGQVTDRMQQMFTGVRVIKAFRMEEHERAAYRKVSEAYLRRVVRVAYNKALSRGMVFFVSGASAAVVFFAGMWILKEGYFGLTKGQFISFILATVIMYKPARILVKAYNELHESMAGARRIFALLDLEPEVRDKPDAQPLPLFQDRIEFRDVTFAYEDGVPVLHGVNLSVRAGEKIALVGPAGAGKSTLLDLVARLADPTTGVVSVDGRDLRDVTHESLLGQVAVVTQHPFLFNTTIAENIRYGKPGASEADVVRAATIAGIHDEIMQFPGGYETAVGERGENLSGGQRQRVTIARAVIRDAPILLLDEATSSLDSDSEKAVQEALDRAVVGRTTFIVAHRLSTITEADRIVVVCGGMIEAVAPHAELLETSPTYARLWSAQMRTSTNAG